MDARACGILEMVAAKKATIVVSEVANMVDAACGSVYCIRPTRSEEGMCSAEAWRRHRW